MQGLQNEKSSEFQKASEHDVSSCNIFICDVARIFAPCVDWASGSSSTQASAVLHDFERRARETASMFAWSSIVKDPVKCMMDMLTGGCACGGYEVLDTPYITAFSAFTECTEELEVRLNQLHGEHAQ